MIELAPQLLVDDLARVDADLASARPELVVIGRRQLRSNNSWMHNLPVLVKDHIAVPRWCARKTRRGWD